MDTHSLFSVPAVVLSAQAPAPAEEETRHDDERVEELDKYDISTLACTD